MEIPEDLQGRYSELSTWIRGPVTEDTTMPSELGLLSELILIERLAAAQERIKVLEAALKYRRFGDTATLFERCVDMLEGRDRELELLKGEKWTSLYLNHFRNAIAGMRTALKEPPCS